MSFGFSPSDILLCIHLIQQTWYECREAPGGFKILSDDLASLEVVMRDAKQHLEGRETSDELQVSLRRLIKGCNETLNEIQALLKKYASLGTSNRKLGDRLRWNSEQVERLRLRILSNTSLMTALKVGMIYTGQERIEYGQERIEKILRNFLEEHQQGLRRSSIVSDATVASAEEGNEATWQHIGLELEAFGITPKIAQENRGFIVQWIKEALQQGQVSDEGQVPAFPDSPLPLAADSSRGKAREDPLVGTSVSTLRDDESDSAECSCTESLVPLVPQVPPKPSAVVSASIRNVGEEDLDMPNCPSTETLVPLTPQRFLKRSPTIKVKSSSSQLYSVPSSSESDGAGSSKGRRSMFDTIDSIAQRLSIPEFMDLKRAEMRQLRKRTVELASRDSSSSDETITSQTDAQGFTSRWDLEDPSRAFYRKYALYGKTKQEWHTENPFLYSTGPDINQLQLYLLGISHGHYARTTCVLLDGDSAVKYQCKHPGCGESWRDEKEHKAHQQEHAKLFLCQEEDCTHTDGFSTNIDLLRHLQADHGHGMYGSMRGFVCAADACPSKDKVWLHRHTFQLHCDMSHCRANGDELLERSSIVF